jgi:anti-anti-sigma factor
VTVSQTSDALIVRIKGEARFGCAGGLLDALLVATAQRPAIVTLDLTELSFISGSAMGVLVTFRRDVMGWGGRVRLAGELQPIVQETLARTRLLDLFESCAVVATT